MDLGLFFGRFHPLVVHLPIGFLLLAAFFEGLSRLEKYKSLKSAVTWALLLGAISALASVIFGLLISGDRGYDDGVLSLHKWFGILVFVLSVGLWAMEKDLIKVSTKVLSGVFIVLIVIISLTGHLGGTLTHGEGYLVEYAPGFIKTLAGGSGSDKGPLDNVPQNPDSVIVFTDMVLPIIETKCMPCHSETQAKGGLVLTSYETLMEGGDGDATISAGKPLSSELFRRITLPVDHQKFMPLKEEPLEFTEVNLIKWWIETGAKQDDRLSKLEIPDELAELLMRDHKINVTPKPYYEQVSAAALTDEQLKMIGGIKAFNIKKLSANNNFLDVGVSYDVDKVTNEDIDQLMQFKDHITWLDLKDKLVDPEVLSSIGQLEHLTRLNISGNNISDDQITSLTSLKHLESLNLVGTKITDSALDLLVQIPSLKRIYVWQTGVTQEAADQMMKANGSLDVIVGYQLAKSN
ncbi:MAG: DUF2231 domain-containing protein [Bacteroidota bacterium]